MDATRQLAGSRTPNVLAVNGTIAEARGTRGPAPQVPPPLSIDHWHEIEETQASPRPLLTHALHNTLHTQSTFDGHAFLKYYT